MQGELTGTGELTLTVSRKADRVAATAKAVRAWRRRNWWRKLWAGELCVPLWAGLLSRVCPGVTVGYGTLRGTLRTRDGAFDLGVIGHHLVTTAGKNFVAGAFNNTNELETLKYHGYGTGTTAAAAGDTALQTELTTEYVTNSTRPTGSQSVSTNTYTTAATLSPDSGGTIAVTEWGLFSASSAGTLFDRQVFSAVNLVAANGDSLTTTYTFTQN